VHPAISVVYINSVDYVAQSLFCRVAKAAPRTDLKKMVVMKESLCWNALCWLMAVADLHWSLEAVRLCFSCKRSSTKPDAFAPQIAEICGRRVTTDHGKMRISESLHVCIQGSRWWPLPCR